MGYVHEFSVDVTQNHMVVSVRFFLVHLLWAPFFHTGRRLETEALCGWVGCFVSGGFRYPAGGWQWRISPFFPYPYCSIHVLYGIFTYIYRIFSYIKTIEIHQMEVNIPYMDCLG